MAKHEDGIGTVLDGRYELTAHLSAGRFGDFWHARRLADGAGVAVKLLRSDLFQDDDAVARFQRETRVLAHWKHPNLLRVFDQGQTEDGVPWLVTQRVHGRHLSDDISDLALSVEDVCHIAAQIARVLAAAAQRGIVHRGLGPDAIFLCTDMDPIRVKVLDFGLAHLTEDSGEAALTQVGVRLGRPEYQAPEYIEDGLLDARSDLYVLGILVFEMLCGQPPFVGDLRRVMIKQMTEPAPPPSHLCMLDLPAWLDALVLAMLEKDPAARPPDALTVSKAFRDRRWPL